MPARLLLSSLSPAFERRPARTPLRRRNLVPILRPISTTPLLRNQVIGPSNPPEESFEPIELKEGRYRTVSPSTSKKPSRASTNLQPSTIPPPSALSTLLSRLSLPVDKKLHPALIACLTHPSYRPPAPVDSDRNQPPVDLPNNNELLSHLGNSLLGLFTSEHLTTRFPLLPTEALKAAVTAYVGVDACVGVARELGVGVQGGGNASFVGKGKGSPSAGIPVRWARLRVDFEKTPIAKRFKKFEVHNESTDEQGESTGVDGEKKVEVADTRDKKANEKETFEKAVAASVRSFIGLIYQEQGIHAARAFTHAHFLSRHLDLTSLFSFKNPKSVLRSVVTRHLAQSGVKSDSGEQWVESRMLAQTGANTQSPIFNVGLFLKSGIKLSEGHGSSIKMAEHRAATNALLSLFLVRGDKGIDAGSIPTSKSGTLPSAGHVDFPVDERGVSWSGLDVYEGSGFGGLESLEESSRRSHYEGRYKGAKRTNAL